MASVNQAVQVRNPVFLGLVFPYQKGPEGIPATAIDLDLVRSDLSLLLNTRKLERVMLPNFGLDLERLIFDNTGPLLRAKAFRQIADAIGEYEPRVSIVSLNVTEDGNSVLIELLYRILGLTDSLSLEFNREGNA